MPGLIQSNLVSKEKKKTIKIKISSLLDFSFACE